MVQNYISWDIRQYQRRILIVTCDFSFGNWKNKNISIVQAAYKVYGMPDFALKKTLAADRCKNWTSEGKCYANVLWVKTSHWNSSVQKTCPETFSVPRVGKNVAVYFLSRCNLQKERNQIVFLNYFLWIRPNLSNIILVNHLKAMITRQIRKLSVPHAFIFRFWSNYRDVLYDCWFKWFIFCLLYGELPTYLTSMRLRPEWISVRPGFLRSC